MKEEFALYFGIGWEHIVSIDAVDHLLFLWVLAIPYNRQHLGRILLLATGFTLGHSLTLLLCAKKWIFLHSYWVELLIPATIVGASIYNYYKIDINSQLPSIRFPLILNTVFGLIHGMGFAGSLVAMFGQTSDILWPMLAFNLGIEAGQFVVILFIVLFKMGLIRMLPRRASMIVNGSFALSTAFAIVIIIERI